MARNTTPLDLTRLLEEVEQATRTDPRRAVPLVRSAFARLGPGRDAATRAVRARLFRFQAHARRALNDFTGALVDYRRAMALFEGLGDRHEWAITQIGRVPALFYRGRHAEALAASEAARRVFLARADRIRVARLDTNTGNIHHRLDRPAEALACYDRALRVFRRLNDEDGQALVQLNRGNALVMLGRTPEAREAYQAARARFARQNQDLAVAEADYGLAYLLFMEQRLTDALRAFDDLRPKLESLAEHRLMALCDMDSAETYLRLNLWSEAEQRGRSAARAFRTLRMRYEEARSESFRGAALVRLGRPARALAAWRRADRLFEAEGNRTWQGILALMAARLERQRGRLARARQLVGRASRLLRPPAPPERAIEALYLGGLIRADEARTPAGERAATRDLRAARDRAARLGATWLVRDAAEALGELALRRGRPAVARRNLGQAVQAGESLRALLAGDEYRAAFFRDRAHPYLALARLELDAGHLTKVYEWIERGRARTLIEGVGLPRPRKTPGGPGNEATARELESLLQRLGRQYEQTAGWPGQRPAAAADLLPDGVRRHLEDRASRLMNRLDPAEPGPAGRPGLDWVPGRKLLLRDEAILSWFEMDGRIHGFVETADDLRFVPDLATVSEVVRIVEGLTWQWGRFRLGTGRFEQHSRLLLEDVIEDLGLLHGLLVSPLLAVAAGCPTWIIVPSATMASIPFAALHDGRQFLMETRRLAIAPGRSVLALCRARSARRGSGTLLVGSTGPGTSQVPRELAAVARTARKPVTVLQGAGATVGTLLEQAPAFDTIHVATHGFFHMERPRLSGVRLADRWLHSSDLDRLNLRAGLVVLSACQSGTSLVMGGDEWMGLPRAFLKAGAARVLASLWDVDDEATRQLMTLFSRELSRPGQTPAAALQIAQRALLLRHRHPYFWAGFQLLGAP